MAFPVQVGGVQGGGFWDLASTQLQQRQLQQQKQQQAMANMMAIADAFMKQKQAQQEKKLKERELTLKEQPQLAEISNAAWMAKMMGDEEGFQRYSKLYTDILDRKTTGINLPNHKPLLDYNSIVDKYGLEE